MKIPYISRKRIPGDFIAGLRNKLIQATSELLPCPFCAGIANMHLNSHIDLSQNHVVLNFPEKIDIQLLQTNSHLEHPTYYTITAECSGCGITTEQEGLKRNGGEYFGGPEILMYGVSDSNFDLKDQEEDCNRVIKVILTKWNARK